MTTLISDNELSTPIQPTYCNPWRDPIRCPLILYTILVVIGLIINLASISRIPTVDRDGRPITSSQRTTAIFIAIVVNIIVAILFGWWMYSLCRKCQSLNAWLVFLLAILFPIIITLISAILMSAILGLGYLLFR